MTEQTIRTQMLLGEAAQRAAYYLYRHKQPIERRKVP